MLSSFFPYNPSLQETFKESESPLKVLTKVIKRPIRCVAKYYSCHTHESNRPNQMQLTSQPLVLSPKEPGFVLNNGDSDKCMQSALTRLDQTSQTSLLQQALKLWLTLSLASRCTTFFLNSKCQLTRQNQNFPVRQFWSCNLRTPLLLAQLPQSSCRPSGPSLGTKCFCSWCWNRRRC